MFRRQAVIECVGRSLEGLRHGNQYLPMSFRRTEQVTAAMQIQHDDRGSMRCVARQVGDIEIQTLIGAQALNRIAGRYRQCAARGIFGHCPQARQIERFLPVALHGQAKKPIQKHGLPTRHGRIMHQGAWKARNRYLNTKIYRDLRLHKSGTYRIFWRCRSAIVTGSRATLRHASASKESAGGRKDRRDQTPIIGKPSRAAARIESLARRRDQAQGPLLRRGSDLSDKAILIQRRPPIAPVGMQHRRHLCLRLQASCRPACAAAPPGRAGRAAARQSRTRTPPESRSAQKRLAALHPARPRRSYSYQGSRDNPCRAIK